MTTDAPARDSNTARPMSADDTHPQLPSEAPMDSGADRLVSTTNEYAQTPWRDALVGTLQWHRACANGAREEIDTLDRQIADLSAQRRAWADQHMAHTTAAESLESAVQQATTQTDMAGAEELAKAEKRIESAGRGRF